MAWEDTNQHLIEESEHLTNVVIGLIKKRLKTIPQLQSEANKKILEISGGKVLKGKERKRLLKLYAPELYRLSSDLAKEVDKLNRSLGELYAGTGREKANFLEKDLFEDLFSGKWDLTSEQLTKRLAAFETKLSTYKDTIKSAVTGERFTVGHHQHLSSLRDLAIKAKKSVDPTWWGEYTRRLNELGYDIGDLGMKRITPITHKPLQKFKTGPQKGELNVLGFLADAGITEKTPGFKELLKIIEPITAHAEGNISAKIPAKFANLNVDDAVEASLPYLDVEKARTKQAELTTQLIRNWHGRLGGKSANINDINKLKSVISRIKPLDLEKFYKFQAVEDAHWLSKAEKSLPEKGTILGVLKGSGHNIQQFFKPLTTTYNKLPKPVKFVAGTGFLSTGLDVLDVHAGGVQAEQAQSQYEKAGGRLRQMSGSTGLSGTGASILTQNPAVFFGANVTSFLTGLSAMRADHLAKTYKSPLEKVTESLQPDPTYVAPNNESGVAEIKPLDPYVGISTL